MTTILLEFAIRIALIAAGTAAVLWVLRIRAASVRHAAWSAVVVTMLVLPLAIAGGLRLSLPLLTPTPAITNVVTKNTIGRTAPADPAPVEFTPVDGDAVTQSAVAPVTSEPIDWRVFLIGAYVAGAVILLLRLGIGTVQANRLRRVAVLRDDRLTSDRCTTPITVGWFKPALILPRGWDQWSSAQLAAVLTHEQEHARRHDPLIQWLALLNRAVFWFHPLAWWLEGRLSTLAEEACDAVVLAAGHSPQDYSEYLLDMARTVTREHGRINLVGMAMPGTGLPHRLRLIVQGLPSMRVSRSRIACTIVLCAGASVMFAAGTPTRRSELPIAANAAPDQKFDLATIKPCPRDAVAPPNRSGGWPRRAQVTPDFARWECLTVADLAYLAYVGPNRLLNSKNVRRSDDPEPVRKGPAWAYSERFTIEAKAATAVNQDALTGPMLRALLEDRFQLKTHRATEDQPVYVLTLAKGGLNKDKVKPTAPSDCVIRGPGVPLPPRGQGGYPCGGQDFGNLQGGVKRVIWTGTTLREFLNTNGGLMDRFVVDKTGIDGQFNIEFDFVPDDRTPGYPWPVDSSTSGTGQSVFKALEGIGLHLEPSKAPAEYVAIDRVERPKPSDSAFAEVGQTLRSGSRGGPDGDGPEGPPYVSSGQGTSKPDQFNVVSIKPCPDMSTVPTGRGAGPNLAQTSPGHVYWACVTLAALVDQAYAGWDFPLLNTQGEPLSFEAMRGEARDDQKRVRGGPSWMYSERFTIEATASVDVINPPAGAVNLMRLPAPMNRALRAMLEDRFQVKLRRETEERPMYALTVGKSDLKIKPRAPGDCEVPPAVRPPGTQGRPTADGFFEGKWFCSTFSTAPLAMQARLWAGETLETVRTTSELDRRYEYRGVALEKVADQLAHAMDRFVLDKTGVAGEFLLAVEFKSNDSTPGGGFFLTAKQPDYGGARRPETPTGNGSTIFQAFEALGLKLEPTKGPAEYLAIESVQRPKPDKPRP